MSDMKADTEAARLPILDRLLDLELPVAISLGHANLAIKHALKMKPGSFVQLDREAAAEVDLLIHGTLVARGELVLVDENYGVRITQIVNRRPARQEVEDD